MATSAPDGTRDAFIACLAKHLSAEPTTALNPRCLSEHTLYRLLNEVFKAGFQPWETKKRTVQWLQEIGILSPIVVEGRAEKLMRRTTFYRLDVLSKTPTKPSPLELLQAFNADGIICYFTSLAFHGLTTQVAPHHHIAIPVEAETATPILPEYDTTPEPYFKVNRTRVVDPLGTRIFTYASTPYYKTSRQSRLIPGVQMRFLGETSVVRITTIEQSLLDTLHRPISCGGQAVVMEAWEHGLARINEEKLAKNIQKMDYLPIAQRVGYMLDQFKHVPGAELKRTLADTLSKLDPTNPTMYQQLFPGMQFHVLIEPWLVYGRN